MLLFIDEYEIRRAFLPSGQPPALGKLLLVSQYRYIQSYMTFARRVRSDIADAQARDGGCLFIDGAWTPAAAGRTLPVINPASGEAIGTITHTGRANLDHALEAADKGFRSCRKVSAFDRSKVMRKAANLLRDRACTIAPLLTMEQGKPLAEAKGRCSPART
jgi:hypothetical protein